MSRNGWQAVIGATMALALAATPANAHGHRHWRHHRAQARISLPAAAPESVGFSTDRLRLLDDAMHGAVDRKEIAGVSTMVVRHGRTIHFDAYGKKSLASGEPVARDTIFRLYSQTKPLTGVAMMILFEQGKWRLEDPVTKYIPEFANLKVLSGTDKNGNPVLEDMAHPPTMRELMTHSAGFGYGLRSDNPVDLAFQSQHVLSSNGLQQMVTKVSTIPLRFQPGTRWSYSIATDIQGYIVEKLSGQSLADFMRDRIFLPLGMKDTGFVVPPDKVARLAAVYAFNPSANALVEVTPQTTPLMQDFTQPPPLFSGGGGIVSTIDDYARFCQMILNGGALDGVRILSPASIALMEQNELEDTVLPELPRPGYPSIGTDMLGFGLDVAVLRNPAKLGVMQGEGTIWWGGAAGTWFWIDPKNDLFFLGMIQRFGMGNAGNESLIPIAQTLTYSALLDPKK